LISSTVIVAINGQLAPLPMLMLPSDPTLIGEALPGEYFPLKFCSKHSKLLTSSVAPK
jgi:hypothetical protein